MATKVTDFQITLLGERLVPVKTARDLGVILDSSLTFNDHVIATVSSCMSRLSQINRVKHCFDKHTLIIKINALVFSKLFYCFTVWSKTSEAKLSKIQAVQNYTCRIVSGARKYDHVTLLRLSNGASNRTKLLIVILNLLYPPQTRAHCHTKSPVNSSRV